MHILKNLLVLLIFVSCTQLPTDLRSPSSNIVSKSCLNASHEFSLDYLTHPQREQFKNAQDFIYFTDTLTQYKVDEKRLLHLAADPDHNNFISKKSIQEAESVLIAERKELIPGPIIRGPEEIDFYDDLGRPWDVKTPISPSDYDSWNFQIEKVANSITHQLSATYKNFETGEIEPVRVLIDLRMTNERHRLKVNGWIYGNLLPEEISRIRIIQ